MKRVYIASPLSAPTRAEMLENVQLARRLCLNAMLLRDVAAFAPHAFFSEFLDDTNYVERELGMNAGQAWLEQSDEIWIFSKRGISIGMARELELAARSNMPVIWDPLCWEGMSS